MQQLLGYLRKAIVDYNMIRNGDKIAVGVSGGKDSLALLEGLFRLKRFIGIDYTLTAVTLDLCFGGKPSDFSDIEDFCENRNIPFVVKLSNIGEIIFDIRKESHPCSLCARMRRGALHDMAIENDCNKIAFGHHFDDVVETFLMNLFYEGRIDCFSPVTYLSRKDITLIRPMIYAPEKEVIKVASKASLPVCKNLCPADGVTSRQDIKLLLADLEKKYPDLRRRLFGALKRGNIARF